MELIEGKISTQNGVPDFNIFGMFGILGIFIEFLDLLIFFCFFDFLDFTLRIVIVGGEGNFRNLDFFQAFQFPPPIYDFGKIVFKNTENCPPAY